MIKNEVIKFRGKFTVKKYRQEMYNKFQIAFKIRFPKSHIVKRKGKLVIEPANFNQSKHIDTFEYGYRVAMDFTEEIIKKRGLYDKE